MLVTHDLPFNRNAAQEAAEIGGEACRGSAERLQRLQLTLLGGTFEA